MVQQYPKMVYKTREDYTQVNSEAELASAKKKGYGPLEETPEVKQKVKEAKADEEVKNALAIEEQKALDEAEAAEKNKLKSEIKAELKEPMEALVKAGVDALEKKLMKLIPKAE